MRKSEEILQKKVEWLIKENKEIRQEKEWLIKENKKYQERDDQRVKEINKLKNDLNKEIKKSQERDDQRVKELKEIRKILAKQSAKIAFYESPNMSSSKPSMYNQKRKAFREGRGEDPAGNPGDKAKSKKRGPPLGHKGISHNNKPTGTQYYNFETDTCNCGGTILLGKTIHATKNDFDQSMKVRTINAAIQQGKCGKCGKTLSAKNPFVKGTSLGPVMLAFIKILDKAANTSANIASIIYDMFGFYMTANTVNSALEAISHLVENQNKLTEKKIEQECQYVGVDETTYKRGDGHNGYVWVVNVDFATLVLFTKTRAIRHLEERYPFLKYTVGVVDGYRGYIYFFSDRQRCWRHILAEIENLAAHDTNYEKPYDSIVEFYRYIKTISTLNPFTMTHLNHTMCNNISLFQGTKIETLLKNALPNLFTFLAYPGMPPHNNHTEQEIRNIVLRRNVHHKTVTDKGRMINSKIVTYDLTCEKQGVSTGRGILELIKDPSWNIFERDKDMPHTMIEKDGTRFSVFDYPGPPKKMCVAAA